MGRQFWFLSGCTLGVLIQLNHTYETARDKHEIECEIAKLQRIYDFRPESLTQFRSCDTDNTPLVLRGTDYSLLSRDVS